jgi:hypothetical protein
MKKILSVGFGLLVWIVTLAQNPQLKNNNARIVMLPGSWLVLNDMSLVNNGVFNQSTGVVKMTGENNSVISGTALPGFYSLQVAKNAAKEIQLLTNINVSGEVSFISGLLNLNNRNLVLLGTATVKGETELRRIIGPTGGYVETTIALNAPAAVNPGNLGAYIYSTQNLGTTIIRRGHQSQLIGGGNNNSLHRYYDILPLNNTALNATLRFQYFDAELNGLNENNVMLFKKVNNVSWVNQGYTARSATANYVIKNAIPDFFRWTISTPIAIPGRSSQPVTDGLSNSHPQITKTNIPKVFIENLYPTMGSMQNVYIKTGNADVQKMQVTLFDIQGKAVLHQQINYQSQWVQLPALLAAGMYKVVIQSGEWIYQQSFVKQ